jgi:hypothetical protein
MDTFDDAHLPARHQALETDGPGPAPSDAGAPERRLLELQRQAGNAGVAQLLEDGGEGAAIERLLSKGGQPLEKSTRARMETAFGESFDAVRVHTGAEATASAQRLSAHAYTLGNDVVFSDGHYNPESSSGQRTLAHELTHVVQQRSGPVDGTDTGSGVKVSDPGDRFERAAEAAADRVTAGQPVQREAAAAEDELDETAQGLWVQREEADDELTDEA